ncbi:MAG: hypothetical protein MJ091_06790, partial [Clostridia bacterium]|nr:hypothetical protein [Clostridia bacterium]
MKKKRSPLQKVLRALLIFVGAIIFLLLGIRIGEKLVFLPFYTNSTRVFASPGMTSGFVGQGLDYVEEKESFLAAGYDAKKGNASSVYVIAKDGKQTKCELKNPDGSNYTGHTGGVAHYGDYAYITGAT